jgi:lysyl-tRNA synthetase class II
MKLSSLLTHRLFHVHQARLANLAFAHQTLTDFAQRLARARITGRVRLQHAAPDDEQYCATLTALDAHQSVIEEHFTDSDIMDLADVMGFLTGHAAIELTLRIEDIGEKLLSPIRAELEREGVHFDATADSVEQPKEK